jgi:hypothetical protein
MPPFDTKYFLDELAHARRRGNQNEEMGDLANLIGCYVYEKRDIVTAEKYARELIRTARSYGSLSYQMRGYEVLARLAGEFNNDYRRGLAYAKIAHELAKRDGDEVERNRYEGLVNRYKGPLETTPEHCVVWPLVASVGGQGMTETGICSVCEGRKMIQCPNCYGHGTVVEIGWSPLLRRYWPTGKEETCSKCSGDGKVLCHACGGSGLIVKCPQAG